MPNPAHAPHTVDSLLRVVQARDAEVALLKLLVDKLKVQLLRQVRARFGASSEQLDDPQIPLIADLPMHELAPVAQTPKAQAANSEGFDRSLPAHLPRENHVYRPEASDARRDAGRPSLRLQRMRWPAAPDRTLTGQEPPLTPRAQHIQHCTDTSYGSTVAGLVRRRTLLSSGAISANFSRLMSLAYFFFSPMHFRAQIRSQARSQGSGANRSAV
ncbi:MAG: transposase [Ottowia sp.]|nr:transposase [Ottowia sp.]